MAAAALAESLPTNVKPPIPKAFKGSMDGETILALYTNMSGATQRGVNYNLN